MADNPPGRPQSKECPRHKYVIIYKVLDVVMWCLNISTHGCKLREPGVMIHYWAQPGCTLWPPKQLILLPGGGGGIFANETNWNVGDTSILSRNDQHPMNMTWRHVISWRNYSIKHLLFLHFYCSYFKCCLSNCCLSNVDLFKSYQIYSSHSGHVWYVGGNFFQLPHAHSQCPNLHHYRNTTCCLGKFQAIVYAW